MKTVVYMSNQSIAVVEAAKSLRGIEVKNIFHQPLPAPPQGADFLGSITLMANNLAEFWRVNMLDNKNVQLVLDAETALIRSMIVPPLAKTKIYTLIDSEFEIQEQERDLLYDYTVLQRSLPEGGGLILATAMEREIIQYYQTLFKNINVRLTGIDLALPCMIKLVKEIKQLNNETFIFSLLENQNIVSLLFVDGNYSFSNRGRLLEQRGTPSSTVEISRTLSSLIQFNYAQQNIRPIKNAYLCGLIDEEIDLCPDMASSLEIGVGPLAALSEVICGNIGADGLNQACNIYAIAGSLD